MNRFLLMIPLALAICFPAVAWAADKDSSDTAKAAATRMKLTSTKLEVEWKDTLLRDVIDELKEKVNGLGIKTDRNAVVLNTKITLKAKDKTVVEVLDMIAEKYEFGWYVIARQNDAYEGNVYLTKSKERGYEAGKEPTKTDKPEPKKEDPKKPKDPKKEDPKKEDPKKEDPKKEDPKKDPPADDEAATEKTAANALKFASGLLKDGLTEKGRQKLQELVKKYPKTKAAETAKELLEKLDK